MISIKSLFIPYPYFCGQTKYIVFHEKNYNYRCNFRHRSWIGRSLFSRRLSYRYYRSQGKSIRRGMRPGQRQTILSSVRHHRYTSYHFIPRNSHSKDGWNGYIDYLCWDRRTKPRTLLPIGRTYLTNERDRIHQHRRLGFPYFEQQKSGHLVTISSVGGTRGSGIAPAYNASKAYQINYMEGLRQKATKSPYSIYTTDIVPDL